MDRLLEKYYEMFKGLPNYRPIVRNNIPEDAFTVVVLDLMYKKLLKLDLTPINIDNIASYIVAPPDGGIDIFIEHEDGDDYYYDIIQVKYSSLGQQDINQCFALMQRTIKSYLKDPQTVHKNLREIISNTNFDATFEKNCTYYVIHKGDLNYAAGLKKNEKVITVNDLMLLNLKPDMNSVPKEVLKSDGFNNFIAYNQNGKIEEEEAYLCNLNGYDLALLNNKYASTELGKNILFGQNLRDSLENKSKTYAAMKDTIDKEPEKFWFYNNGITIIAEGFNAEVQESKGGSDNKKDLITLENFSIINGAQTTSSLGLYLKEATMNKDDDRISKLKNVYVLTRILVINKQELKDNISIYNNMQNPITSRDMVSNRLEQKELYEWLIGGEAPNIFVEIRRGRKEPSYLKLSKHQSTTNETLAQLAFAAFYKEPYTAKDKKRTLFNNDYSNEEVTINADYHKIFNYDAEKREECGILFKKSKQEIDELLFIAHLYKESKKYLKKYYDERLEKQYEMLKNADEETSQSINSTISNFKMLQAINNICLFYCVTLYYEFKFQFEENSNLRFDYIKYYDKNSSYKQEITAAFADLFLTETIEIIKEDAAGNANVGNWIRIKKSQEQFMKKLRDRLSKPAYLKEFQRFEEKFKSSAQS